MNEASYTPVMADRKQEAYRIALALFQQNPDWVTFFREILGIGGVVRRLFPEDKALLEFENTTEHAEIQLMLARLRQKSNRGETQEPTRVITVRLPQSLHEALQAEAHLHQTSMNKLCISKLLQVIEDEFTGQTRNRLEQSVPLVPPRPAPEQP
jgi:predicted HicB family RNase H-like nuclease